MQADIGDRFPDVPIKADYCEAVNVLAYLGILGGEEKGSSNKTITRTCAGFATLIVCCLVKMQQIYFAILHFLSCLQLIKRSFPIE